MTKRSEKLFIKDIFKSISKIQNFVSIMTFEDFCKDEKTISAVVRELEVIGEASKNISIETKEKYKNIEWRSIAKTRDKIIHWYFDINYKTIWEIIIGDLP